MKVAIKTTKEVLVPVVKETIEEREYGLNIYPVQYRNYPGTIHIQGTTKHVNRDYGFAFDIPGHSDEKNNLRLLPSKAGTREMYWNGTLVVNGASAVLLGASGTSFDVPLSTLPDDLT